MKKFILSDTLWGAVLSIVVLGLFFNNHPALESLELKFFDFRSNLRSSEPSNSVALVTIDDDSLAKLGRWPWPRETIADMIKRLDGYGAKVIGLDILFSEPESSQGLQEVAALGEKFKEALASGKIARTPKADELAKMFALSKEKLDQDSHLAYAIAASSKVVVPLYFDLGKGVGAAPKPAPPEVAISTLETVASEYGLGAVVEASEATFPLLRFAQGAVGVGHVNTMADVDGALRRELAAIHYGNDFFPSFSAELVRQYQTIPRNEISFNLEDRFYLGKAEIPLDGLGSFMLSFYGPEGTFTHYSFYDVMNEKVQPEAFKDKIVIIGPTATGIGTQFVTPASAAFPAVELVATAVENVLQQRFLYRPVWADMAELILLLVFALYITFVLPRLKAMLGALLSGGLLAGVLTAGIYLFVASSQWIKAVYPAFLLAAGYTLIMTKRFLVTEKKKELVEASQIETNKMLGLSFQGQGMLDLAFDKFRGCPLDEGMLDLLYNLGLDFERKRQYNKAVSVYEHMAQLNPVYKGIDQKMENLKKAADGAVFGGAVGKKQDATIMVEGASLTPTLGRYEVMKELGRGAMGIVYLGRDPKINRQVAIKTMALDTDVGEKELKELKMRFFREAESAGNLNHPNIVRIFDAGEEHDVCFIAMELLSGADLKERTAKDKLLPVETALEYVAKTADALDYAHQNGVVHRDIKPANIMLLSDGTIRVADFGIARIASSSKTATGTVMGTPSYMSPEQVAGKKVDGRADLFSLGVSLFELLTGEKPFKGGDSIGTLLFQIASDPHPDIISVRADLPAGIRAVINKALTKKSEDRYQRGADMAADLRAVKDGKEPPVAMADPKIAAASSAPVAAAAVSAQAASSAGDSDATMRSSPGDGSPAPVETGVADETMPFTPKEDLK